MRLVLSLLLLVGCEKAPVCMRFARVAEAQCGFLKGCSVVFEDGSLARFPHDVEVGEVECAEYWGNF